MELMTFLQFNPCLVWSIHATIFLRVGFQHIQPESNICLRLLQSPQHSLTLSLFFYNRMARMITVWFAWILLPLLLFCFDLIPLPLTMVHSCSISWSQIFSLSLQFALYFFTNTVFVICSLSLLFELKIVYNSHYYFVWILLNSSLFFFPCRNIVWKTGITRLIMFYQ